MSAACEKYSNQSNKHLESLEILTVNLIFLSRKIVIFPNFILPGFKQLIFCQTLICSSFLSSIFVFYQENFRQEQDREIACGKWQNAVFSFVSLKY